MRRFTMPSLVLFFIFSFTGGASAAPQTLSFAFFTPESSVLITEAVKPWIKWLHGKVGDEIQIKIYAGGSLGRDPSKQYKMVQDGVVDIAMFIPSYNPGKFPDTDLMELPGMAKNADEGSRAIWKLYERGKLQGFDDVKLLSLFTLDAYHMHLAKPVSSLADIKGLKIRAAGHVQTKVIEQLGGIPVAMPATRAAENINNGLLDGTILSWGTARTFKITEVTKYHLISNLGVLTLGFALNKETYNKMSDKAKAAIDESGQFFADTIGKAYDDYANNLQAEYDNDSTHKVILPDDTAKALIQKISANVKAELIKTIGVSGLEAYEAVLTEIRNGK